MNDEMKKIDAQLLTVGLRLCGSFAIQSDDDLPLSSGTLCLVGQTTLGWQAFQQSTEYQKSVINPLDSYAKRICQTIADNYQGQVIMPNDGPPFYPFLRWAKRAEAVNSSPLGLLLHPQFGLWHAYRAAILLPTTWSALPETTKTTDKISVSDVCSPCQKPCLTACPVDAFSEVHYNVVACKSYLQNNANAPCHTQGCLARVACPQGKAHEYHVEHKAFLMRAFTG